MQLSTNESPIGQFRAVWPDTACKPSLRSGSGYAPSFLSFVVAWSLPRFDGESYPAHLPIPHSFRSGARCRREPLGGFDRFGI